MAKGQKHSNREVKKPKSDKKKGATVSASPFSEPPSKVKPAKDK